MNPLDRLKTAEQDGQSVTLDPSELSFINEYFDQQHRLYTQNARHLNKVRRAAMETAEALRGYNPHSTVADEVLRAVRG